MKRLFIIRHAKSSWQDVLLKDFDRPLNKRGQRDAPFMGKLLAGKEEKIDQLVASPANRATTTAKIFANALGFDEDKIIYNPNIYEAHRKTLLGIVEGFDDSWNSVAMFGHNPGFTNLANNFTTEYITNLPTCGIVKVVGLVDSWKEFTPENASVRMIHFPKQYFD